MDFLSEPSVQKICFSSDKRFYNYISSYFVHDVLMPNKMFIVKHVLNATQLFIACPITLFADTKYHQITVPNVLD